MPVSIPERVTGVVPDRTASMNTFAPAGVELTATEPVSRENVALRVWFALILVNV
jgi:hypothetical protein